MKYKKSFSLILTIIIIFLFAGCKKNPDDSNSFDSSSSDNLYTSSECVSINSSEAESCDDSQVLSNTMESSQIVKDNKPNDETKPVIVSPPKASVVPQVKPVNEMRAVWISFLEYDEILRNKTKTQFINKINEYFNNCVNYGINTVIVQVRSHGDAMYPNSYFPSSVHFTGVRTNNFPFDPLSIMVYEAHRRGLKIEAWVNPYRANKVADAFSSNDIVEKWKDTDKVYICGDTYYFNPGEPEVQNLVISGINEIVRNYDIDGIHFDDYFYPNGTGNQDFNTYNKYGSGKDLDTFRTDSVNKLISSVYSSIKSIKNITFGISPAGNIDNCVYGYHADVRLWGSTKGYVDYIAPQLYWAYNEGTLPYSLALEQWKNTVTNPEIMLIVGLAAYKVGKNELWSTGNVLYNQVKDARNISNYSGFILFRYKFLFSSSLDLERNNLKSIF